jgi:cleavage stimulation factor subunit 3
MDIASFALWNDYVKFLKAVEAPGSYAENQKISAIRKVYQRGVINPMNNIEQFWYVNISGSSVVRIVLTHIKASATGLKLLFWTCVARQFLSVFKTSERRKFDCFSVKNVFPNRSN